MGRNRARVPLPDQVNVSNVDVVGRARASTRDHSASENGVQILTVYDPEDESLLLSNEVCLIQLASP